MHSSECYLYRVSQSKSYAVLISFSIWHICVLQEGIAIQPVYYDLEDANPSMPVRLHIIIALSTYTFYLITVRN